MHHRHRKHKRFQRGETRNIATRVLTREELKTLLLSLIEGEQRHGYELIRRIKSLSKGTYAPSSGMVYPALAELEEQGFVSHEESDGGRKIFSATDAGKSHAASEIAISTQLRERLGTLGDQQAEPASVQRALAGLEMALGPALAGADLERIDQVVDLIDELARKIERLDR